MKRRVGGGLVGLAFTMIAGAAVGQPVVYVDQNAAGVHDGSSWTDAYVDLQSALDAAEQSAGGIREIWVAAGTYKPSKRTNPDDPRSATFSLLDGVSLFGGFAGTETTIEQRDLYANSTILSGDLNGDDQLVFINYDENAYHVVTARGVAERTTLDCFTIENGSASGPTFDDRLGGGLLIVEAWPVIQNCDFIRNVAGPDRFDGAPIGGGGGAYVQHGDSEGIVRPVVFRDCRFSGNKTLGIGGGLFANGDQTVLEQCTLVANNATDGGAIGIANDGALTLSSCDFEHNTAEYNGGAIAFEYYAYGGLQIDDCHFGGNSAETGGAVYSSSGPTRVSNSRFERNRALRYGGALYLQEGSGGEVVDSSFRSNSADLGGAICASGIAVFRTWFLFNQARRHGGAVFAGDGFQSTDCGFFLNWTSGSGGGLYFDYGAGQVSRCFFGENVGVQGGAISVAFGSVRAVDCEFDANSAVIGGAVSNDRDLLMDRCSLTRNSAQIGGGISATGVESNASLVNCLVSHNQSEAYGGGIAGGAGVLRADNCTIAHNTAGALGAGMIVGDDTTIRNSIVWGNVVDPTNGAWTDESAQIDGIERAEIAYSDVQGWSGTYGGDGNFALDPLFVEPLDPDGPYEPAQADFHLQPDSPCINAGLTKVIDWGPWDPPPPNLDLDGQPRVLCDLIDLGAYEMGLMGDVDCDQDFDLEDFSLWNQCAFGPGAPGLCPPFDADGDGDIDLRDLAGLFQLSLAEVP